MIEFVRVSSNRYFVKRKGEIVGHVEDGKRREWVPQCVRFNEAETREVVDFLAHGQEALELGEA